MLLEPRQRLLQIRRQLARMTGVLPASIHHRTDEHPLRGRQVPDDVAARVLAGAQSPVDVLGRQGAEERAGPTTDALEVVAELSNVLDHAAASPSNRRAITSFWICEVPS